MAMKSEWKSPHNQMVNKKTGEISNLANWDIFINDDRIAPDTMQIDVHVTGRNHFSLENVGWRDISTKEPDEPKPLPIHDEFGLMLRRNDKRQFSMVYHSHRPDFSSDRFYKFWDTIQRSIEQNTGTVLLRQRKSKTRRVESVPDWQALLQCCRNSARCFTKECVAKEYLAKLLTGIHCYWIINPLYAWNGYLIPENIAHLFLSV